MKNKKKRSPFNWALYCMLIPGFLYLLFNNYIPMAFTMIAFKKYNFQKFQISFFHKGLLDNIT